jgi:hypothetical protein
MENLEGKITFRKKEYKNLLRSKYGVVFKEKKAKENNVPSLYLNL